MHETLNSYNTKLLSFCIALSALWHIAFVYHYKIDGKQYIELEKPALLLVSISNVQKNSLGVNEIKKKEVTQTQNNTQKTLPADSKKTTPSIVNDDINIKYTDNLYFIKKITPKYPLRARQLKQEGDVEVVFSYENGKVNSTNIRKSSGYKLLDKAAVEAIRQYLFTPDSNGISSVKFSFRLQEHSKS
jgi:protein TonB